MHFCDSSHEVTRMKKEEKMTSKSRY